ncbi:AMP-binding protein [Lacisediminimonas profundi]|uniref:AMP-binding protein n=1 Tax=Lacisediminimonas profundi TaxID=2603856 RepID=UPI00124AEAC6|nr:AMP-binding protein [Lacisediminimonas profundi]
MSAWIQAGVAVAPDFNGPVEVPFQRFEEAWIEQPIFARFLQTATVHAGRVAITDARHQFTYAQVLEQVRRLAQRIAHQTDHADCMPVGIMLGQDASFPVAALACLAAGRPYVPIDLKYPPARIAAVLADAGSTMVIAMGAPAAGALPQPVEVLLFNDERAGQHDGEIELQPLDVSAPAVILYTSGSTGRPKGICNNQRALLQRVCEATNSSHINYSDQMLLLSSPGTIAGEREMFAALLNGATLTLCDPQRDGLHGVLQMLEGRGITLCYMVPALFRMLLRAPGAARALSQLRVLRIGGDITLASDLLLFRQVAPPGCHFLASFSATEMPAVFQWFVPRDWQPDGPRVPVGYARPEVDFCALDENGQPARPGEFAELVVRSPYLAMGQWQDGRLQPGAFVADPADASLRILHSGDMVRARSDGLWELTGRKDRQIKIHGQRVDAGEVEALLRSHAGVEDVAVIARRKGEETVALVAFVVASNETETVGTGAGLGATPASPSLVDELRRLLAQRVPGFMRPAQIHRLPAIPQLPGFKPDIAALHRLDQEFQLAWSADSAHALQHAAKPDVTVQGMAVAEVAVGDVTGSETAAGEGAADNAVRAVVRAAVRQAWSKVLSAEAYRLDLPFDDSGGDSLKALELWFHVEEALGFKLGLDAMAIGSRPSELEQALAREITNPAVASASLTGDGGPLIYLAPGILGDDPMQLRFRAAFGDSVRFKLLDYPGWRETMAEDCSFHAIVDSAYRQICADPPQQVYRLAGYSYGGIVAFELARRLVEAGHKVGLVALLDSRRWDLAGTRPLWQEDQMLPERGIAGHVLAPAITVLVRAGFYRVLGLACTTLTRHANRVAFRFRNRMTKDLRFEALRKWKPRPLAVPVTLFVSSDRWPGEPEGYGWDELCSGLTTVHIGGTHASMIDKPGRERIAGYIREAVGWRGMA